MGKFFRKLFYLENPAAGAVAAWVLMLASLWCLSSWFCFADLFTPTGGETAIFASLLAVILVELLIVLYCAFLLMRFYFLADRTRWKWLLTVLLLAQISLCSLDFGIPFIITATLGYYWLWHILLIRQGSIKWYILQALLWAAWLPIYFAIRNISSMMEYYGVGSGELVHIFNVIPLPWRTLLTYICLFLLALQLFSCFKLYAAAMKKTLREVWSLPCTVLVFICFLTYIVTAGAALYKAQQVRDLLGSFEKRFQKPLQITELEKSYFNNRPGDPKFFDELNQAFNKFYKLGNQMPWLSALDGAITVDKLPDSFRKLILSREANAVAGFFDSPLPAYPRKYVPGNLAALLLPELRQMRSAARLLAMQGRIACDNGDRAGALTAWKRLNNVTLYLRRDTILISSLVLLAVDTFKLDLLQMMLSSRVLTDEDLQQIQLELQKFSEAIFDMDRNVVFTEAVFARDVVNSIADGTIRQSETNERFCEGTYCYRLLHPALWYFGNGNTYELLKCYDVDRLSAMPPDVKFSLHSILAKMMTPALSTAADRMYAVQMRYQAFIAVIEAEKIRRKSGSCPAELSQLPTDHFSGSKLLYKAGRITVPGDFLTRPSYQENSDNELESTSKKTISWQVEKRPRTVNGVMVWSVGSNKLNDNGFNSTRIKDRRTDDMSAIIAF